MTRLYLLVTGDFVKTGGMDRANHALADYLSRQGDEVHLVAYRADADLLARSNVTLHRVPKPLNSYSLGRGLLDRTGRIEAARIARRGGTVIVNGANCRWGDVNWVHHINALDPPGPAGLAPKAIKARFDRRAHVGAERSALGMARRIVTTCRKNRDDLVRLFDLPADRIEVVYYGNDRETFRPARPGERDAIRSRLGWDLSRPVTLFVGGLGADRRKGFDTLYTAWARLCLDPAWPADLVVVGDGSDRSTWQGRAERDGLGTRVRFLGFRRDVSDLFRACDAHVLPSRYEGYSLVTQEALCSGLPAFVTRTAGIAERYEGPLAEILLIPDPNDATGLADRLKSWPLLAESVRSSLDDLSAALSGFTWDDMAAGIAEVVSGPA